MNGKTLSYSLAAALWIFCAYQLGTVAFRAATGSVADAWLIGPLFAPGNGSERLIPTLILIVFGWVLLEVLFRAARVRREVQAVQELAGKPFGKLPAVSERVRAGRRVRDAKAALGPEQVRETLAASAALDAVAVENVGTLTKVYVWILPVLGFIGTAMGMATAIGGFREALGAATAEAVTARLSQLVIPGLANAFGVTMLALAAATIAHFLVMSVQSWDDDVLHELDRQTVGWLAALPSASAAERPRVLPDTMRLEELIARLTAALDRTANGIAVLNDQNNLGMSATMLMQAAADVSEAGKVLQASTNAPYHITIKRGANE